MKEQVIIFLFYSVECNSLAFCPALCCSASVWLFWINLIVSFLLSQGGNVDLRRVPHCLDPLRRRLGLVSLWTAGFSPHPVLSDTNAARKVSSHVQPHHLPGHWLQVFLLPVRRAEGQELFEEIKVISSLGSRIPLRIWCSKKYQTKVYQGSQLIGFYFLGLTMTILVWHFSCRGNL